MSNIISGDYVTTADAAKMLEVSAGYVRQLIVSKRLESEVFSGRRYIKRASVMAYAATPGARGHKKKVQRGAGGEAVKEG
jgi:excisionase family DNA binding protein